MSTISKLRVNTPTIESLLCCSTDVARNLRNWSEGYLDALTTMFTIEEEGFDCWHSWSEGDHLVDVNFYTITSDAGNQGYGFIPGLYLRATAYRVRNGSTDTYQGINLITRCIS